MLFPYVAVDHSMDRMQEFVDFIFHEVWCKAPIGLEFHTDLFEGNPDLQSIMSEWGYSATNGSGKAFYKDVKAIYESFASLAPADIDQFKKWYLGNNDIEKICANDPAVQLARYADIASNYKDLSEQLASLFKNLYSKLDLKAFKSKVGTLNEHYDAFVTTNNIGKCPFCGINDLLGADHSKRDAYDHYLPKSLYPFNSVNFKNLVPACHHCNSSYKTTNDPTYVPRDPAGSTKRRSVFYPFTGNPYSIELQIVLHHTDIENLTPKDIDLQIGPAELAEEIDTWKDVYGIEERYKIKYCGENDGKYWLVQAFDEFPKAGFTVADYLPVLASQTELAPYADCNFLKRPLIEAFQNCESGQDT